MIRQVLFSLAFFFLFLSIIVFQLNCGPKERSEMTGEDLVAKGKYLVTYGGCNHCHSPKVFTEMGPIPDSTRLLSGYPSDTNLPPIDTNMVQPGKWIMTTGTLTAWVGPWGISYAANITPDESTGIGTWTEELFMKALRSGKHMGVGRPILPPMPWYDIGLSTDEDLKAIFAYLRSLPPIHNQVPDPVPPNMLGSMHKKM